MKRITQSDALPADVVQPRYDRSALKPRIAHIGFGAFHRAHQAVYADVLAQDHGSDWGYCEINLIGGERQIADIREQDHLFTVAEMAPGHWNCRVVGVVRQALHAAVDGMEAVLDALCGPDIAIVSITVTEKGYCHQPASGQLDREHPLIQHDLAHPGVPQSTPGVIVEALRRRRARGLAPFSVMSCDNMPENGHVTRNVVLGLARAQDPQLADWIEAKVSFPSTMVDRIVPAVTPETLAKVCELLGGIDDPAAVAGEPFRQWVIEDNFVAGRPAWEKAGAELVADVLPYEEMKLRMLNGSHSFLAYLGYLGGYAHICDCMEDADYATAARALMVKEQAPTLRVSGVDLETYADLLTERYRNNALKHRTWQIAMDGSQKLPQRLLDPIRWHLAHGSRFDHLALGVAAWMRYVGGVDEKGQTIEISDPLRDVIAARVAASAEGGERVHALLSLEAIFGRDLPDNEPFVQAVSNAYNALLSCGAREAVRRLNLRHA
ncbi:mannitol dehydrogenase family protein [Uliginosibacterium sp. H1]|uniref:mannitol dehydrogenase family protein n=1 Tax=Uliginosibacterium sp. H1 TaxID=3114757 RepID=UPI002E1766BF|nr:fructuronate reductase [Uliginosibacterium sp. H1]